MNHVNIYEMKTHLSRLIKRVQKGETILLCRRNVPIAEIRPVEMRSDSPRPLGLAKGQVRIPKNFFRQLPEEILDAFEGHAW